MFPIESVKKFKTERFSPTKQKFHLYWVLLNLSILFNFQWLCARDISRMERRYMFADSSCFMLLTPLGFTSSWLCITGAQQYYSNDEFWTGFGLVMLTGFLTIIYLFWIAITLRYHYTTFRQWQRSHTEVRLVFSNKDLNEGEQHVCTHRRTISLDAEVVVIDCDQIDNQLQPINDLQSQAITPV